MKSTLLGALLGLNLVLLVAFGAKMWRETPANAQAGVRPGDYMLIPAEVTGQPNDIVYIVDIANRQLSGMQYDDANKRIANMAPIDLNRVFAAGGEVNGRRKTR